MSEDTLVPSRVIPPGEDTEQETGQEVMTAAEAQALAIAESTTLEEDEEVIGRGLRTFLEVGAALDRVRIAKKYLASYSTFEEYLRFRWDISGEYAYQQMDAAKDTKALPSGTPMPVNVGQARALHKVPEVWRADVMVEAASADHLTARVIDIAFDTIAIRAAGEITLEPVIQFLFDDLYVNFPGDRQVKALARHYTHPVPEELDRIRASEETRESTAALRLTPEEWLLRLAVNELAGQTIGTGPHKGSAQLQVSWYGTAPWSFGNDTVGLPNWTNQNTPGKPATSLRWRGKTIKPSQAARDKRTKAENAAAKKEAAAEARRQRAAAPDDPAAVWAKLPEGQQAMLCELRYWHDRDYDMDIPDRTLRRALITAHLVNEDGDTGASLTPAGVAVAAQAPADFYAGATEALKEEDEQTAPEQQHDETPSQGAEQPDEEAPPPVPKSPGTPVEEARKLMRAGEHKFLAVQDVAGLEDQDWLVLEDTVAAVQESLKELWDRVDKAKTDQSSSLKSLTVRNRQMGPLPRR